MKFNMLHLTMCTIDDLDCTLIVGGYVVYSLHGRWLVCTCYEPTLEGGFPLRPPYWVQYVITQNHIFNMDPWFYGWSHKKSYYLVFFRRFSYGFLRIDFQPMVWVFGPWFYNYGFGDEVLEVSKYLILYSKQYIKCNEWNKESGKALKASFLPQGFQGNLFVLCECHGQILYFY